MGQGKFSGILIDFRGFVKHKKYEFVDIRRHFKFLTVSLKLKTFHMT